MIISKIQECKKVNLLNLPICDLYMHPIDISEHAKLSAEYSKYNRVVNDMLSCLKNRQGEAFVTIDTRIVEAGSTHRRPGKHVDGNFIFDWQGGGGGWLTGSEGRILSPKDHKKQYCDSENGATLIVSDFIGCKAWEGEFNDYPKQGGDCSHIDTNEGFYLKQSIVYLMNSTAIHESMPLPVTTKRTLVRITLPPSKFI